MKDAFGRMEDFFRPFRNALLCVLLVALLVLVEVLIPDKKLPSNKSLNPFDLHPYSWFLAVLVLGTACLTMRFALLRRREQRKAEELKAQGFAAEHALKSEYKKLTQQLAALEGYIGALSIFHATLIVAVIVTDKFGLIEPSIIPGPFLVFDKLSKDFSVLMQSSLWSLIRLVISLVLGTRLATAFGVPLGQRPGLRRILNPHIELGSALPPIVLAGLFVAVLSPKMFATIFCFLRDPEAQEITFDPHVKTFWFFDLFFEESVQIVLTTWAVFWPIFTAAVAASIQCPRNLLDAAEISGATQRQKIGLVVGPLARPHIYTNLRVAVVIGFIVLLWIEAARPSKRSGLGRWVYDYYDSANVAGVLACIVLTVVMVILVLRACDILQRRKIPWLPEYLEKAEPLPSATSAQPFDSEKLRAWIEHKRRRNGKEPDNVRDAIVFESVAKSYGPIRALEMTNQSLKVASRGFEPGNIVSVIGQSGHGKTTLAKIIAGLLEPDRHHGRIAVFGNPVWIEGKRPANHGSLSIAYVFQDFALFPHMTVKQNILFPLHVKGKKTDPKEKELQELLVLLDMTDQKDKYPLQLSGGQKQRVAIARALMQEAELLILDEPLASLDQPTRGEIRKLIKEYARACGIVVLNISHDRHDVLEMSDNVLYLNEGQVRAYGFPSAVFFRPRDIEVAQFLGHENLFVARLEFPFAQLLARIYHARLSPSPLPEGARLLVPLKQVDESEQHLAQGSEHSVCIPATWINFSTLNSEGTRVSARILDEHVAGPTVDIYLETHNGLRLKATVQDDDYRAFCEKRLSRKPDDLIEFTILGATPIFGDAEILKEITV